MRKWDVCIAAVPYEDLPTVKVRPVVVLEDKIIAVYCLKMTSQSPRKGEYVLQKWREAGLHKPTTVRISKRLQLSADNIIKRIGALHPVDVMEIQKLITQ